jgi:RNA polymerase sigma-B factor
MTGESGTGESGTGESGTDERDLGRFAEYQRTRDHALRNELIEEHMGLAVSLARRFAHRGEDGDDLNQVAMVGLLKAVERFDVERGVQFSTFATPTIVGELKRHFRDRGWAIRVPRRLQELMLNIGQVMADLGQELGRAPTPAELAARAGVTEEEVLESMEVGGMYRLASLDDRPGDDNDSAEPSSWVGVDDAELASAEDRLAVQDLLTRLPERERQIVYLRFFEGLTQSEIADQVGISQMHVSRLLIRSLEEMAASTSSSGA